MTTVAESGNQSSQNAALTAGIATTSLNQTVTFIEYSRTVLPLDGFVFWVRTPNTFTATGSVHIADHLEQREDETIGISRVTFTTLQEIQDFSAVAPGKIYIGSIGEIRFSFADQANFYQAAGLWHYRGDAIYPVFESQIIDNINDLDLSRLVISNSLPIWLSLPQLNVFGYSTPQYPIYPSFLIPQDISPPYISVHIPEDGTEPIGAAPWLDSNNSHWQLCKDRVRIVLYGLSNQECLDFQDFLFAYINANGNMIGLMNVPVMRDDRRGQRELGIISQRKIFTAEVSYYQSRINDLARQYILTALVAILPNPL